MSDIAQRYSRHLMLKEVGTKGQERLLRSRVLIVGCGGLGSPVAYYLGAAGVGTIGLMDFDNVELSNLQRQILHSTSDVGKSKLKSAKAKLLAINPKLHIIEHAERLAEENVFKVFGQYDLIVDGTDNFPTRYIINDACVLLQKPYVYGSIFRFEGMVSLFEAHLGGPCYRCWYPEPPTIGSIPSCSEAGVLGVICGVIGTLQANEAIKWILKIGHPLKARVLRFDALNMEFQEIRIAKDPACRVCGNQARLTKVTSIENHCEEGKAMQDDVSAEWVNELLKKGTDFQFIDVRNANEYAICHIQGTKLLPMSELPARIHEIAKDKLTVLHCHHGGRSRRAVEFLKSQGYSQVKNLAGGIDRWSLAIDPNVPRY